MTNAECDACHTSVAWLPAAFDHDNVAPGTCSSCHDGVQATGVENDHFQTALECDRCHTIDFFEPDVFAHQSPNYPGAHADDPDCDECHQTNAEQVTWTSLAYQYECAGCHENDFKPGPHKKHENPDVTYLVSEVADCTGSCHMYDDSTLTTIKKFRPGPEHQVSRDEW